MTPMSDVRGSGIPAGTAIPAAAAASTAASPDLVILGGGSGGYAAALRASQLGLAVTLIERDRLGGTCLHRGCIPTKAFLHAAEVADAAREGAAIGIHASVERVEIGEVRDYAERVISKLYKGLTGLVGSRGITVINGEGRLVRADGGFGVAVNGQVITAPAIVLATGSAPRTIPGVEVDGTQIITSDHALQLSSLPAKAIVLGGGVIGVEFASAWRSFGVEVTIVEALDRLVPAEEPAISTALQRAFRKRGITMLTGTPISEVRATAAGVTAKVGDQELSADLLLVAVGRGPASAGLGYEEAGVRVDRGAVVVDDRLRTTAPGVWAVGDLVPGLQLAHRGFAHGIFVAEEIAASKGLLEHAPILVADPQIPRVTYCDPQIASVGLSEAQAREAFGEEVETLTYDLAGNGRAQILQTQGSITVIRRRNGPVVGIHMIGAGVGELIGEAQLITNWEAYPEEVASLIHAHPTLDEALGEAHLALAGKPLHSHS